MLANYIAISKAMATNPCSTSSTAIAIHLVQLQFKQYAVPVYMPPPSLPPSLPLQLPSDPYQRRASSSDSGARGRFLQSLPVG